MQTFGGLIDQEEEIHRASKDAIESSYFVRLGLTDSLILEIMRDGLPLLTTDALLYAEALNSQYEAVNFAHLQAERYWS